MLLKMAFDTNTLFSAGPFCLDLSINSGSFHSVDAIQLFNAHLVKKKDEAFLFVDAKIYVSFAVLYFPDKWCALQYSCRTPT